MAVTSTSPEGIGQDEREAAGEGPPTLTEGVDLLAAFTAAAAARHDAEVAVVRTLGALLRAGGLAGSSEVVDLADADRFDELVCAAIDDLRAPEDVADAEEAVAGQDYLAARHSGDGTVMLHGEYHPVDGAVVLNAIDAQAARDSQQHGDRRPDGKPMSRAQRRARALVNLCRDSLAGHTGHPVEHSNGGCCRRRPAHPSMVVHVPLERISQTAAGLLEVAVPGYLPTLTARTVEALAADAEVRVVIFNGHRPLAVTRKLHAQDVPEDTRLAVQARDLGARDPGGRTTVPLSDVHHLAGDRVHDPDQMAVVSPRGHHRILHRHGWTGHIDPDTGQLTWTSPAGQTITTLPWDTRLRPPE
jgi:hypothetical protein